MLGKIRKLAGGSGHGERSQAVRTAAAEHSVRTFECMPREFARTHAIDNIHLSSQELPELDQREKQAYETIKGTIRADGRGNGNVHSFGLRAEASGAEAGQQSSALLLVPASINGPAMKGYWCPHLSGTEGPSTRRHIGHVDIPRRPRGGEGKFVFTNAMNGCAFVVTECPEDAQKLRVYHHQHPEQSTQFGDGDLRSGEDFRGGRILSTMTHQEYARGVEGTNAFNFMYYEEGPGWRYGVQPQEFTPPSMGDRSRPQRQRVELDNNPPDGVSGKLAAPTPAPASNPAQASAQGSAGHSAAATAASPGEADIAG